MRPTASPTGRSHCSPIRASIASSTSSASLWPPRAKNLIPLSGAGLWLADSTTPRSAPRVSVRYAIAGVGITPARITSTPAEASPAATAASRNSPEARGSRPTTAFGRCPAKVPRSASTCAAAIDRSRASSAVRSLFARPRTPSVPKRRAMVRTPRKVEEADGEVVASDVLPEGKQATPPYAKRRTAGSHELRTCDATSRDRDPRLPLAVLRSLAGLLETGLLALLHPGVAGEESGLLQNRAVRLDVRLVQRAGDAQAQRAGLAGDAAAVDPGDHVVAAVQLQDVERLVDFLLVHLVREVRVEGPAVDLPLAGAGHDAHAGHGLLAAPGAAGCDGGGDLAGGGRGRGGLGGVALGGVFFVESVEALDFGGHFRHCRELLLLGDTCQWQ